MRSLRPSLALIPALALAACGGGSSGDDGDDANTIDATRPIDGNGAPDGTPAPDAAPGAYDCIGDPFPTTAPDPIAVNGITNEISTSGQTPISGVTVEAFDSGDNSLGSTTSAATTGAYALSLATGGDPLDGYLHGTKASYKETYVYPPQPLANDQANVPVLLISTTNFGFIPIIAQAPQDASHGFVGLLVVDCLGNPVAGATVTVEGADPANVRYPQGTNIPTNSSGSTDASGIALVFDVPVATPPAPINVNASAAGHSFNQHAITVRAGVITTSVVAPGPITGLAP